MLPGEASYRSERRAFVATMEALDPVAFTSAPTLCTGWAPRDVLAHLLGIDRRPTDYLRAWGRIDAGNAASVAAHRTWDRAALLAAARRWAAAPALHARGAAAFLLGDLAVHHQDVLRPAGMTYPTPPPVARAVLREGVVLGGRRLLTHRVVPTDGVGRPLGRGRPVRGDTVVLGLWLAGRRGLEPELEFG